MRVSLNTIKQFTPVDMPVDELVAKINTQLGGVEATMNLATRYEGAVIVRVVACEKHHNADKLSVCTVDDGGVMKKVPRDADGYVQVVCGAPNVHEGMYAVWLPPGTSVPSSFDDKEPFVLDARELRGVLSQGMLASPKELGLGDGHDGILEIDPQERTSRDSKIQPGAGFAEAYGLNDTIVEIENKMFTHRPDCFGQLGVAREIAGIQHTSFTSPEWYVKSAEFKSGEGLDLKVHSAAPGTVPRFMAVAIKNVAVTSSPVWLQAELVRLGGKPINTIVDVTNYVMLLTGQPLHAYDYDSLRGGELGARTASKGENVTLLNGKAYTLDESDIVIVDGQGPVGLGGIMGGGNSEVSDTTKNIVLECATFDMYAIRKTSMRHGLFTDAVTRFNKGQSPLQNDNVLLLAMNLIDEIAGGELASQVHDIHGTRQLAPHATVAVTLDFINERLGLTLAPKEVSTLLRNVEFAIGEKKQAKTTQFSVTPPFWRTDIELPEDVVEEVGRLYGFDKLPRVLPQRTIAPTPQNPSLILKRTIREKLARLGANEVLTYSFVHEKLMKKAGQDPSHAYRLSNALSPDLQYYRTSLTPSLLDKIYLNYRAGYDEFALFEIGKTHFKGEMELCEQSVPNEDSRVAFVISHGGKNVSQYAAYYRARRYMEEIFPLESIALCPMADFDLSSDVWGAQLCAAYEPARSAVLVQDKKVRGVVGEFTELTRQNFKLPANSAGFELHLDILSDLSKTYRPLSRFPSVWQDISLKSPGSLGYAELYATITQEISKSGGEWHVEVEPRSIYQDATDSDSKTTTFRLTVASSASTLTDKDVSSLLDKVAKKAASLGATRI